MMSDFPGAITKQSFAAPPAIMRSTRYSLTAQGRSRAPSLRLPTGSNSLENASGWMRLPRPAAGMTPHMSRLHKGRVRGHALDQGCELACALARCVLVQHTLTRTPRDARELRIIPVERSQSVASVARHDDLVAEREEIRQARPVVADDRRAAGCGLEEATGWTPAHARHRGARDVEGDAA